jgi:succinate dehydrogenase / fumarate reductase, membrane anchor subunit
MSEPAQALSQVIGRGSAHEGAHHWRTQRLTALALLILAPWLVISLLLLPDLEYATVRGWSAHLGNAALLALFTVCACWHSQLGVQVVIEDYVRPPVRMVALVMSVFAHVLLGVLALVAVLRLALGPAS